MSPYTRKRLRGVATGRVEYGADDIHNHIIFIPIHRFAEQITSRLQSFVSINPSPRFLSLVRLLVLSGTGDRIVIVENDWANLQRLQQRVRGRCGAKVTLQVRMAPLQS